MRTLTTVLALAVIIVAGAHAQTDVGGVIDHDVTWTMAAEPYFVSSSVHITDGSTLTIEPGVRVFFQPGTAIRVDGVLVAEGSEQSRITFTSARFPQSPGDWDGVRVGATGGTEFVDGNRVGGSVLRNVDLRFAQRAIEVTGSGILVEDCRIEQNFEGVALTGTRTAIIRGNLFRSNHGTAIYGYASTDATAMLYDTRIVDNVMEDQIYRSIVLEPNLLEWLEIAHNRMRGDLAGIDLAGVIPGDVRSVHVHHNLVESATGGIMIATVTDGRAGGEDRPHVLVERNIVVQRAGSNVTLRSTPQTRIEVLSNTFADGVAAIELNGNGQRIVERNTIVRAAIGVSVVASALTADVDGRIAGNTIAYGAENGVALMIGFGSTYRIELNDIIAPGGMAMRLLGPTHVQAPNNYWAGATDSAVVEQMIWDNRDNGGLGRVLYMPIATVPSFQGPLVPPRNAYATYFQNRLIVTWDPTPDPRATGYRIWYDRQPDGRWANWKDVSGTSGDISGLGLLDTVAVTAHIGGARGEIEQLDGRESWFAIATPVALTSADEERGAGAAVGEARPNPTTGRVVVPVTGAGALDADIFDATGTRVRTLRAAAPAIEWDGRDEAGATVASGVYVMRVVIGGNVVSRRIVVAR